MKVLPELTKYDIGFAISTTSHRLGVGIKAFRINMLTRNVRPKKMFVRAWNSTGVWMEGDVVSFFNNVLTINIKRTSSDIMGGEFSTWNITLTKTNETR